MMDGKGQGKMSYIKDEYVSFSIILVIQVEHTQFPIIVCYSTTVNKSQSQSLDWIDIYFPIIIFSHGQIYVAISMVNSQKCIKILIAEEINDVKSSTTKFVYKEVFHNI